MLRGAETPLLDVFFAVENGYSAFEAVSELRAAGLAADTDHAGRSLKGQLTYAQKHARATVVVSAEDPFNNVDTSFNGNVTISLPNASGVLAPVQAQNGVATFGGLKLDTAANGGTIGFNIGDPKLAEAWHKAGVANGGTSIEDPPGVRANGAYLAYLRDPDGNKLVAVARPAS